MKNFRKVKIQKTDFDIIKENKYLIQNNSGALVNFIGTVRGFDEDNKQILSLTLEHYPGMTESEIHKIIDAANKRWVIDGISIIHRVGKLFPKDNIVYIGVSSRHRQNAFNACNYLIDWLKTKATFWKSEELINTNKWVKHRKTDSVALSKWVKI